jgi:four helix bundle protein
MATVNRLEDLETWKLARMLAQRIFQLYTSSPLFSKDYKLKDQINGSSGSVMDNIAEGFDRGSRNEFINFLSFSKGSIGEVKSQLYRGYDRQYFTEEIFTEVYDLTDRVGAKIASLIKYLNRCGYQGTKFKDRKKPAEGILSIPELDSEL